MAKDLNPKKALIFRVTHINNVPWTLDNGLHCRNSRSRDPNFVSIGNIELIDRRAQRLVPCPPGGTLSDYVPFYFTPFSPMLLNIKTGYGGIRKRSNEEIVILASSLHSLQGKGTTFLFTDRHAYLATAQFYSDLARLDQIDWSILQERDFKRNCDDPGKLERYQAEALVYGHLPVDALVGIACYNSLCATRLNTEIARRRLKVTVATKPDWYFK